MDIDYILAVYSTAHTNTSAPQSTQLVSTTVSAPVHIKSLGPVPTFLPPTFHEINKLQCHTTRHLFTTISHRQVVCTCTHSDGHLYTQETHAHARTYIHIIVLSVRCLTAINMNRHLLLLLYIIVSYCQLSLL